MADLKLFTLNYPNTCTQCATPITEGYALNADIANAGAALCAKCAGKQPGFSNPSETSAQPPKGKG